jgi:hypothetical protein
LISSKFSNYSDEQLFNISRKLNIAIYQKIIFRELLPLILGQTWETLAQNKISSESASNENASNETVPQYNSSVSPDISGIFAFALPAIIHSALPQFFAISSENQTTLVNVTE